MSFASATCIIDRGPFDSKLRSMRLRRSTFVALVAFLSLTGCRSGDDRSANSRQKNGTARTGPAGSLAGSVPWFPRTAPLLLAPGRSPDWSLIALADTTELEPEGSLLDSNATFIRLDGGSAPGRVAITQSAEGCIEASLDPAPSTPWGVGFIGGAPTPLRVDSMRGMSRQDSSALTRVAYRLASTVPNGPGSRFTGLPFSVVELWRARLPDGATAVAATLRRQINQEDSPLEERTFIIAESDATAPDGYALMYSEQSSGAEETVESRELLAAVTFPPATAVDFIVSHDFGDQTAYSIVERVARAHWVMRWASRRFSC
jgi:hypothetical protein